MNTTHKTEQNTIATAAGQAGVEVSKVAVYAIAFSAGLIGCWSVVCLIAGTISSGGPIGLISNFIKSFLG